MHTLLPMRNLLYITTYIIYVSSCN